MDYNMSANSKRQVWIYHHLYYVFRETDALRERVLTQTATALLKTQLPKYAPHPRNTVRWEPLWIRRDYIPRIKTFSDLLVPNVFECLFTTQNTIWPYFKIGTKMFAQFIHSRKTPVVGIYKRSHWKTCLLLCLMDVTLTPLQLKKDTVDSKVQWTAGCTTNCSAQTPCKASTQPPCHLECCNATMTSCLWLNGTLNFPSSATRGPYLHTEVIACLLCLVTVALMLWNSGCELLCCSLGNQSSV